MSNLNEQDIAAYMENQNTKGFYEVRLLKIPVFDQETGAEIREDEQYTVCNKHIGSDDYPCYDKRTANELCEYLNILTSDLLLEQRLPEQITIDTKNVTPISTLAIMINNKHDKLEELRTAINHELNCELTYLHNSNAWRLKPAEIQQELELSKLPTEKQINAFIEEKLSREFDFWKIAKANTALIRQQLGLIEDRISLEKYAIRLELKK